VALAPRIGDPVCARGALERGRGGLSRGLSRRLSITAKLELRDIRNLETDERTALQDVEIIRADGHGHAACEMLDLCYWAKSAFMMDFFGPLLARPGVSASR
jgi:hypothetical protein